MKYPITPAFLESQPEPIAELYRRLEAFVLNDICSRFKNAGEATETALELIRQLQRRGYSTAAVEKYIRNMLGLTEAQYDAILDRAVERNAIYYDDILTKSGLLDVPGLDMAQEIMAIRRQTKNELVNITRSLGFAMRGADGKVVFTPLASVYQRVLDDAAIRVWSGAESYESAIKQATDALTESGLQTVDYASGWHNRVDVAARRAVMTSITQISSKYSDMTAERVPTDYREVTAHAGARDEPGKTPWASHKGWQGKVYSIHTGDAYPSIYAVCGLGEVDGLCGANCRHMYYPFWEGISGRAYTDEELRNIDPPPFEFEGREYTAYQATQKQRQIETAMRKVRRDLVRDKAAGLGDQFTVHSARYRRLNEEYEAFSKAAGLRMQKDRMRVAGFDNKLGREAMKKAI